MTLLYFDCFSGAAGDMITAALLDAGAPLDAVMESLHGLGLDGWNMDVSTTADSGLRATRVVVSEDHAGPPRSYSTIVSLLEDARIGDGVRRRALETFKVLAEAEGRVHNVPVDEVHFHEAGSTDAIVDVVAASAALEHFSPERVVVSPIATGRGFVESAHGTLPLPAPAVVEILRDAVMFEQGNHETITPTGAAILAAAATEHGEMPVMRVRASGYGAGTRQSDIPNLLRVIAGDDISRESSGREGDILIETNVDDLSPELVPHVIYALLSAGAHDAWVTPVLMKKGRPGYLLSALAPAIHRYHLLEILYRETTTLGVRFHPVERAVLDREWVDIAVEGHTVRVKLGIKSGDVVTMSPEFEDARRVAKATGLPLKDVYAQATRAALDLRDEA
ncbi:MAG TPA: nickel pincer cofactor biosynthesis protein LarC [Actinomycetota bacterium]